MACSSAAALDLPARPSPRMLAAVVAISAATLAFELALMRSLAISRWHHFAYLVVGTAVLGFGASGTWLALLSPQGRRRLFSWRGELTLVLALAIPCCYRAAEALPLNVQYVVYSKSQAMLLLAYQAILFLPFLLAGLLIGLSLLSYPSAVHLVYGANLVGSGLGPAIAVALLHLLAPDRLLQAAASTVWLGALLWCPAPLSRRFTVSGAATALLLAVELLLPSPLHFDPYKPVEQLRRLEAQGEAQHLHTSFSPRSRLDLYASPRVHTTLFAGLTAKKPPPPQMLLLEDGEITGPIFQIDATAGAEILDHTPMSVAYRLVSPRRVLLLGEKTGTNVWLAKRFGASEVIAVQADPRIFAFLRGPLGRQSGKVFRQKNVRAIAADPRHFLEGCEQRFDIIQVVQTEAMAAGLSGLLALHENYLLTVEGMRAAFSRLRPGGVLSLTRGLQSPPRDNIKILATLAAALEASGIEQPGSHLVQVRNHLAMCTLAFRQPLPAPLRKKILALADRLWLDIDWLPGFVPGSRRPFNLLAEQTTSGRSWYNLAADDIFSPRRQRFFQQWAYEVRPATDDRPYFYDFFRWRSLPRLAASLGPHLLRRLELGYIILVLTFLQSVVLATLFLLLPLRLTRKRSGAEGRLLGYFALIGFGYLALEITLMQRLTLLLGDPLYGAAATLSSILLFSGAGSLLSRLWPWAPTRRLAVDVAAIFATASLALGLSAALVKPLASWPLGGRFLAGVGLVAPLALALGWPFPLGMEVLACHRPAMMPWAWGINGFASVAAAPLAVMLAMSWGFTTVMVLGAAAYLAALGLLVLCSRGWRRSPARG